MEMNLFVRVNYLITAFRGDGMKDKKLQNSPWGGYIGG